MARPNLLKQAAKFLPGNNKKSSKEETSSKSRSKNGSNDTLRKATQIVAGGQTAIASLPAFKWGAIVAIVTVIVIIVGGAVNGVGMAVNNITYPKCNESPNSNTLFSEAEKQGYTVPQSAKDQAANTKVSNPCTSGVGYNGDTYPPTTGVITTMFGALDSLHANPHQGLDIAAQCDAPIYAFAGGTVTTVVAGSEGKGSYPQGTIIIKHTEEFSTVYLHTRGSHTYVQPGQVVSAGDHIADQWSSGHSSGCHLHFGVLMSGKYVDPLPILQAAGYNYSESTPFTEAMFPPKPTGGSGSSPMTPVAPGSAKAIAQQIMPTFGWSSGSEFVCLDSLWSKESGWRINAQNNGFAPSSPHIPENQAYGIPQAGPGAKMATIGPDWKTNPSTQIKWGLTYIKAVYGTPCGAWAHSVANNWY